jgi:hypothetical protein
MTSALSSRTQSIEGITAALKAGIIPAARTYRRKAGRFLSAAIIAVERSLPPSRLSMDAPTLVVLPLINR